MKDKKRIMSVITIGLMFLAVPFLFQNNYLRHIASQVVLNIILLLGLNFIIGQVRQMNFGAAAMYCVGAYTTGLLTVKLGVNVWLALGASLVTGIIFGIVLGYPSLRVTGIYLALTTMAFVEVVRQLLINAVTLTGGSGGLRGIPDLEIFGWVIDTEIEYYYVFLIFMALAILICNRVLKSKWGRAFRAVRDNMDSAEACGLNIGSVKIKAFVMSTVLACFAGGLYACWMGYLSPVDFNADMSTKFIMMLLMGGLGSVPGLMLGSAVVTIVPELLKTFSESTYWLVFCGIVMVFAILMPGGLISLLSRLKDLFVRHFRRSVKAKVSHDE